MSATPLFYMACVVTMVTQGAVGSRWLFIDRHHVEGQSGQE